jgi:magnesium chelatase family protein
MAFAKTFAVTQVHLRSEIITVETDVSKGLHHFSIVGLGDKSVEESKERCSLAIKHSGMRSPRQSNEKILTSLAPAHIRKTGTVFDVAISIGYLMASGQIACDVSRTVMLGELSLNGEVKRVKGIIPMIQKAIREGFDEAVIPEDNSGEAAVLARDIRIVACGSLKAVIEHVVGTHVVIPLAFCQPDDERLSEHDVAFDQIRGNEFAKRALLIALSGGHNVCLYGPPGTGKTMLAKASADVLPNLSFDEQVQLTSIYSLSSEYGFALKTRPPFRAPHHSASYSSIVGGGRDVVPGEITLSHLGILFLDEFPEFDRRIIDSLRQPLEDRKVRIARTGQRIEFPCDFQLLCSMNPCPCGYLNTGIRECVCSTVQIQNHNKKISGPIVDRIEMWVEVSKIAYEKLIGQGGTVRTEHSQIARSVEQMRMMQRDRYGKLIARMSSQELSCALPLSTDTKRFYDTVASQLQISARSYTNVLRVALTIMLLENRQEIQKEHLLEALSYRPQEKGLAA